MKYRSFFTKLFLGNLLLLGAMVAVSGVASYQYLNADHQRDMIAEQNHTVRMMQEFFRNLWPEGADRVDAECKTLFPDASTRLTVIAADGRVLGDSQADPTTMGNHKTKDRPEILAALEGRPGRHERASETLGLEFRYLAEPITQGSEKQIVGVVRIAMPIRAMAEGRGILRNALVVSVLIVAVIAVALAAVVSRIWFVPLRRIARVARDVASGELAHRATISGPEELIQVGAALNEMADSLGEKIRRADIQRGNLDTIVRNLREGVVAVDAEGCVVVMNQSARELLDVRKDATEGRALQEVVRVAGVVTAFCEVMETGRAVSKQIERETAGSSKILDLQVAQVPEPSTEGIRFLLVVRDITQQAQTARIKSEFVGNASHELRTPLATIRAAVDSLATLGPNHQQEREKIREMLDRHTARLEEMTNDLLSLHTLETAKQRLRQDEIDPHALAKWAIEQHADKAKERGILLNMPTEPSDASFRRFTSDLTLIQLILRNLIDNALKFTPREGQVSFRLEVEDDRVLLRVSDTGCGIPPEFQDRVFERFFQVEPSRSGDTRARGTGLGLAIVKHATERLGGTVTLRSEPGTGTTVEVRLPKIRSL